MKAAPPWGRAPASSVSSGEAGTERVFGRGALGVWLLALLLLGAGLAAQVYRLGLPTLGWDLNDALDTGRPVFGRNLLGLPSPLRAGDVWLTLDGRPLAVWQTEALRLGSSPSYRAGENVSVGVQRGGEQLKFSVPLGHWNAAAVLSALRLGLPSDYGTLLGFSIAAFVFWLRPRLGAARLLFLFYVAQLLIYLTRSVEAEAGLAVADFISPLSYLLTLFFGSLSYLLLLAPLLLHLCLSFPEPKAWTRRFPWLLGVVYVAPWLALLGFGTSGTLLLAGRERLYLLAGVYSLVSSAVFVHTFMTATEPLRRAQVRWVAVGFVALSLSGVAWVLGAVGVAGGRLLEATIYFPSGLVLTLCLALALLRYRLFDIDIILHRTLVYGSLTACVVLLYVLVVGGVGALLGTQGNLLVSLLGTGLVAALFQPLRERLQRTVNRLLYGQRDEPYALLTRLSNQSETVAEAAQVLPALLKSIVQALKLPYAALLLYPVGDADAPEVVAEYGIDYSAKNGSAGDARSGAFEQGAVTFPLVQQRETFGELRLGERPGGFSAAELRLLTTVAQQAAVAAYAVRQTRALHRSRERLIAARETERLRLRRELHDGLGPTLAGLTLQLGALKRVADQPEAVRGALSDVQQELRRAAGEVRRIVYDLRPPSLDQLGLAGALEQLVQRVSADVGVADHPPVAVAAPQLSLELSLLPELPPATEVAAYRIVQEALTNALKHAQARHLMVSVRLETVLEVIVQDDGLGFPESYRAGVGLTSMRERAEALGGRFTVGPRPLGGTTVQAELPLVQLDTYQMTATR